MSAIRYKFFIILLHIVVQYERIIMIIGQMTSIIIEKRTEDSTKKFLIEFF